MSTKICRFVPVVWLRHAKKRTQNGGVYILEMRVRQAGKMPLKNFDLWLSRNIVTFEHSKLGPVQGVEVLSKDSFNVQHFYTIIQSHGFICWYVSTCFQICLVFLHVFHFLRREELKATADRRKRTQENSSAHWFSRATFIVGKLARRIKLCSFVGSGYGSILPSKKIASYESWQQLSRHEDYPNWWLQERSAIIGHKSTTGGVANIAARLAEMSLAWTCWLRWLKTCFASLDSQLCTLRIWGFPTSRKTQSRQMKLNEIDMDMLTLPLAANAQRFTTFMKFLTLLQMIFRPWIHQI